ncbi:hypothetical protein IFO69_08230 [Echinicola sp. CAU 1574]|uniref:Tetratricopeptide repeat protein n=1 Tax=Echinicola arenosa TaxID=2774144 RepID=A0ABR9AIV1_9BACT|nr:hypothetical protein [Echinicola arenosa]MBD8488728.1 hypothetical protein [Echinicola arenosa]
MKPIIIFLPVFVIIACQQKPAEEKLVTASDITLCSVNSLVTDKTWYESGSKAPLFEGLEVIHWPMSTSNELAQRYFDQGLVLAYGFNHAEAARSFYYASQLDPDFAMAYWGYAYVLGPNYNAGMEADNYERAYHAIQTAVSKSNRVSEKEKALIGAMAQRYSLEVPEDRSHLDQAYSKAMKEVSLAFPEDAHIATLYAESLMDQHPWDLYDKEGKIKAWTPEILSSLNHVLEMDPDHPGGHHLYIHAVEASLEPEQANTSAAAFDDGLVPNAGHLLHMPSHIYIRTGEYHKGTVANIRAIEADSIYVSACHAQGAYPLAYFPHNYHFMAATATLEGNKKWAILAAEKLSEHTNKLVMKEPGWGTLQHYYTIPYYVYVKFGEWDKILSMPAEDSELRYPEAIRNYARGMAFLGKGNIKEAKKELGLLKEKATDESFKTLTVWDINSTYDLLQIAEKVLEAEILAAEYQYDTSIQLLEEAVLLEDSLNYNEPPDWFFSVRHHLGAILLLDGKYTEAIFTYKEDLFSFPKNGWALHGLIAAYRLNGDLELAKKTESDLVEVWSTADIKLENPKIR